MLLCLDTDDLREQPIFLPSFSSKDSETVHVATCSMWFLSFSFLFIILPGHAAKVWAFCHFITAQLCCCYFLTTPRSPSVPVPAQLISILWARPGSTPPRPEPLQIPVHQTRCQGLSSLKLCQGLAVFLAHPGGPPQPQAHTVCLSHIWSGAMSCTSSLCSRFILMVLPCPGCPSFMPALPLEPCPDSCLLTTPASHLPPSPKALFLHVFSASRAALGLQLLVAALPVLPPLPAQAPNLRAGATPHPSTPDPVSPVSLALAG